MTVSRSVCYISALNKGQDQNPGQERDSPSQENANERGISATHNL